MTDWEIDRYLTDPAWMYRQEQSGLYGTHGIGHITRVLVWAACIADRFEGTVRREELLWAASVHDTRRWDDGIDAGHGERAAEWVRSTFPRERPLVARRIDLELVGSLCRDHVRSDHLIEDWSDELRILKDADGLERVRIFDLDPARLRLRDISPGFEPLAQALMRNSVARGNDVAAVRRVAIEMGLWR